MHDNLIPLAQVGDGQWMLMEDFTFMFKGHTIKIAKGFTFDLATIPRVLWIFVAKHELGTSAPLIHDYLYEHRGIVGDVEREPVIYTRKDADQQFLTQLKAIGINRIKRNVAYRFVRTFGYLYWPDK